MILSRASTILYFVTTLTCMTAGLIADNEHTWVGGFSGNDLTHPMNWSPYGINKTAIFTSSEHPPHLFGGKEVELDALQFNAPDVVFHIDNASLLLGSGVMGGALNYSGGNATIKISDGGTLDLVGGNLADEGKLIYELDAGNLLLSPLSEGQIDKGLAVVNMQNGSLLDVQVTSTFDAISSTSSNDRITFPRSVELTLGNDESQIIAGSIEGEGALVKQREGVVTLQGDHTAYSGPITVKEGSLVVEGKVYSPINVLPKATLSGQGSFGGTISMQGGTLLTGNSKGKLQVDSLTYDDPHSLTKFEITTKENSLIEVKNTAQLQGRMDVAQQPGRYAKKTEYTLLSASEISGTFDPKVLGVLPGFQTNLLVDAQRQTLLLQLERLNLPAEELQGNARRVANYLSQVPYLPSEIYGTLYTLSPRELDTAMTSLSPARNAVGTFATQNTLFTFGKLLSSHLNDLRFSPSGFVDTPRLAALLADASSKPRPVSGKGTENTYDIWLGAFGEYAHEKAAQQTPAFHYTTEGTLLGVDLNPLAHTTVGGALGYAHTNLKEDSNAGKATIKYFLGTLYSKIDLHSKWECEVALLGSWNEIENQRSILFPNFSAKAKAKIPGWQLTPHLGVGYKIDTDWGRIQPYAGLDWTFSWDKGYKEQGAGDFNMKVKARESSMLRSELGVSLSEAWGFSWGSLLLSEKLGYINKKPFKTGSLTAAMVGGSGTLHVESLNSTQNLAAIGLQLLMRPATSFLNVSLVYNGEFGAMYRSQELFLKLVKEF